MLGVDPARGRLRLPGPEPHDRPPDPRRGPLAGRGDGARRAAGRQRDPLAPRRPAPVLHVPARGDGAVRTGPGGADRAPRRRMRVLGRRARTASALEARDAATTTSSAPSPASSASTRWSPSRCRSVPGEKFLVTIDRDRASLAPLAARRDAARGRPPLARAHRAAEAAAPYDRALRDRRPARGPRDPGLHVRRPGRAGQGRGPGARRLRLAARRRQALPADGVQRRRADRLAGLRRPARGALARAPEPRRLLQGDGRRRHQPGDRPRARDGALLDPRRVRPPAVATRPGDRHAHGRDLVPGHPRRPPRPGAALRLGLPPGSRTSTRPI